MVALSSPEIPVRACSAWTLGSIGDARAEAGLIECLQDTAPRVRRAAVWALGNLKQVNTSNAIPALLVAMDDADPVVRALAHDSLEALGLKVTLS
ncbi:MAG: HEAT repeat domain-containing protein [Anaerolineae bacterium]